MMKNWKITAGITTIVLGAVLFVLFNAFHLKIARTSSNVIEFAPAEDQGRDEPVGSGGRPRNIIVFIADGLGFSHMSLSQLTGQWEGSIPVWQRFDVRAWHDARSSYGPMTDSAASATAMATGTPTYFDIIGLDTEGERLGNLFEVAWAQRHTTGIVTDSYIWDATPAAFVAHTASRDNARDILTQLAASDLHLLFGELEDVGEGDVPDRDTTLRILEQRFHLLDESLALPEPGPLRRPIAAIYAEDEVQDLDSSPNLTRLTELALQYLTGHGAPFVLLVESEEMDAAGHERDSARMLSGLKSIERTLALVLDFADADGETLVLFTSDHETGGLAVGADWDDYPNLKLFWPVEDHTASVVPIIAHGPGAGAFLQVHRNWQIGRILKSLASPDAPR